MTDIVKAMTLLQSPWLFTVSIILVQTIVSLPQGVTAAPKLPLNSRSSSTDKTLPNTPVSKIQLPDSVVNLTDTVGEPEYKLLAFFDMGQADKISQLPTRAPASHRLLACPSPLHRS